MGSAVAVWGAPKLRLVTTTAGPVSVARGQAGATQTVEAYNDGDGTLNLSAASAASWLAASVGNQQACTLRGGLCRPVRIELRTQALAAGRHSANVTVSDPNALDAPQNILVIVQIGGGVPERVNLYSLPNGSRDSVQFTTNSRMQAEVATQSGGPWLSLALAGGSFRFTFPYQAEARHLPGMAEGTYNGTARMTGSAIAEENRTIAASYRVANQPIACMQTFPGRESRCAAPEPMQIRLAQGAPRVPKYAILSNRGAGAMTLSGVTAATEAGGNWLTASIVQNTTMVEIVARTENLAPGTYRGAVTVNGNAVNMPLAIPVEFEVVTAGPPVAYYGGILNNATFGQGEPLAQGGIVAMFGEQFRMGDPVAASSLPLAATLGDVRVLINGQPAPVYYVQYDQINFQIPYETPPGEATVRVERAGAQGNPVTIEVARREPRMLYFSPPGIYGIARNASRGGAIPVPRSRGGVPAQPGDVLEIYALGLGQTQPPAATGAGAGAAAVPGSWTVRVGVSGLNSGIPVEPDYVGLTPGLVGLYQINVTLPPETPKGENVKLLLHDSTNAFVSNFVDISVE